VAFNKLGDYDKSDLMAWANHGIAKIFVEEIMVLRNMSLKKLIKKPTEEYAADVRAYDKILSLIEEARR
jgi:hypothetical protein